MKHILNDFLSSDDEHIKKMAQMVSAINIDYEEGRLTKSEYKELIADITDLEKIEKISDDLETVVKVKQAAEAMLKLLKILV